MNAFREIHGTLERKNMKISRIIVVMAAACCLLVSAAWAQGQQTKDEQTKAYIDMMRKDIRRGPSCN
jgi:hypothetical protein